MRLNANQAPRTNPYLAMAWYPYSEQEGMNRHEEGKALENVRW